MILLSGCAVDPPLQTSEATSAVEEEARAATAAQAAVAPVTEPATQSARPAFCARPGDDAVRDAFCKGPLPSVRSLSALQALLDVVPVPRAPGQTPEAAALLDPLARISNVVALGHSTALSGHLISPINPRLIIIGTETNMTFQRGVQQIELASQAREAGGFRFYLLTFTQACNTREGGCTPGDLYTKRVETDWTDFAIFDEEDVANTPEDCRQCHQRGRARSVLLMRELESPWTHFFERDLLGSSSAPGVRGADLVQDYLAAKGDEAYGNVPASMMRQTSAQMLENIVPRAQPLLFDARKIESERWPWGPNGFAKTPEQSPTWNKAYEAFKRGEQLALPYFDERVVDPEKQARLAAAYRQYLAGALDADALPDLADIFPDDPAVRARIGLTTEPGATPADALIQACGPCHNDVLDQRLSRARFNIDLSRLDRRELALAIDRIERSRSEPGAMPPPHARQLDDDTRTRLIAYLRARMEAPLVDPSLVRAAKLGMAGGGLPETAPPR